MFLPFLKQAELQENLEARGERMGGVQTHKRMVASLEKQIAVQEKKLEQVRHIQIFLPNIILPVFEEFIWRGKCGFSWVFFVGIDRLLVNSDQSGQSDNDTRIWYHGWAGSKQSLQAPSLLFSPRPRSARFTRRFSFSHWGPFLERPGKFSGPKANFKITTCWIVAQLLAHKQVNFASLNDGFLVLFLKIIEPLILNATTRSLKHLSGPEKFRGLSRNRALLHLRVCSQAIWQPVVHPNSLWWSSVMAPVEATHVWGTENGGLFMASGK